MQSDIQINQTSPLQAIEIIADKLGIAHAIQPFGAHKAKIELDQISKKDSSNAKLVLVTSINPTPAGEGKTTTTIGLADGLNLLGKKSLVCLREPALGPVFGKKGGATGAVMHKSHLWRISICTLLAILQPLPPPITYLQRW